MTTEEANKTPEVVEDAGIEYTEQSDLKDIEPTDDNIAKIIERLTSEDWKENFYGFDDLRSLYAHHSDEFKQFLPKYKELIKEGVENLRSSIWRNSLNLVCEVYTVDRNLAEVDDNGNLTPYASFTEDILPIVVRKIADDKKFLSSRAKTAVENIITHCVSRGMTEHLCELSKSKSILIASESNNALLTNCAMFESDYCKETDNINVLLKTLSEDIFSKRQPFTKNSKLILNDFKKKLGEEHLITAIQEALGSQDATEKLMKAFLVKKKEKDSSKGFKDFLKKKKNIKEQKEGEIKVQILM